MSAAEFDFSGDLESVLSDVLRPIDPPESLGIRVEETLSKVAQAAATELSDWADELTAGETEALKDPRNWVRPVAALAAGGAAGAALLLFGSKRRDRRDKLADQVVEQLTDQLDELRGRLNRD